MTLGPKAIAVILLIISIGIFAFPVSEKAYEGFVDSPKVAAARGPEGNPSTSPRSPSTLGQRPAPPSIRTETELRRLAIAMLQAQPNQAPRIMDVLREFHRRETNFGMDPDYDPYTPGPDGERGEFQIRDIFIRDVERLFHYRVDPMDNISCRIAVTLWLSHYVPLCGARTIDEMHELYRRGYEGYMEWTTRAPKSPRDEGGKENRDGEEQGCP